MSVDSSRWFEATGANLTFDKTVVLWCGRRDHCHVRELQFAAALLVHITYCTSGLSRQCRALHLFKIMIGGRLLLRCCKHCCIHLTLRVFLLCFKFVCCTWWWGSCYNRLFFQLFATTTADDEKLIIIRRAAEVRTSRACRHGHRRCSVGSLIDLLALNWQMFWLNPAVVIGIFDAKFLFFMILSGIHHQIRSWPSLCCLRLLWLNASTHYTKNFRMVLLKAVKFIVRKAWSGSTLIWRRDNLLLLGLLKELFLFSGDDHRLSRNQTATLWLLRWWYW